MASKDSDPQEPKGRETSNSFELQFQEFSSYIAHFEDCSRNSHDLLKKLKEVFKNEDEKKVRDAFMTEKEEKKFQASLSKKSTILVVGQTNSGKSSLVNELLGGSFLPTAEVPCTSRIVRLKYSGQNYVQLLDKAGKVVRDAKPFAKKRIPKDEIALEDTKRSSAEWVEQMVEVGMNNSLLQNGHLEFVDAPGMSENEALDNIVKECLDGVLQVVIYVIDGKSSLRTQERDFLYKLKEKMGQLPIFFVCNKVDRDEEAEEFDRDSDDENESDEEALKRIIKEKSEPSYKSLVKDGLLDRNVPLKECKVYHGVSAKEVRKARRVGVTNQYTEEFEEMKRKLMQFAAISITSYLRSAAGLLSQSQQRVFHFFLSHNFKENDPETVQRILDDLKFKEYVYFDKISNYIKNEVDKVAKLVSKGVSEKRSEILEAAETMAFSPIQIGDVIQRNEVVNQCRTQIQTLVLMQVANSAIQSARKAVVLIAKTAKASLEASFDEVSKQGGLVSEVKNQLLNCILLNMRNLNEDPWRFDYSLMTLMYQFTDQAYKMFSDFKSILTGTTINKSWKKKIAKSTIDHIDHHEIAKRVLLNLQIELDDGHESFLQNVDNIKTLCDTARKQSADQYRVVVANSPAFAEQMCKTEALLQSLSSSRVQLGKQVNKGHRGVVYECSVDDMGEIVVAKQLHYKGGSNGSQYLAVQYALKRTSNDCENILRPVSLRLDFQNRVTILLPKMDMNLYDALATGRVKGMGMSTRLAIVLQMTDACDFSRHSGLYHVDPRITNILLDERNVAKLNVCKTRDDDVPYPDDKAPFHVPQKKPADHASTECYLGHDLYSLGVLLWLLLKGEYCRPKYADTTKIKDVYSEVANDKSPDMSSLADTKERAALDGLLLFAWHAWRNDTPDLSNFQERLSKLHSQTDSETSENTQP